MTDEPAIYQGFPYGAVYFRKTNPPAEDWERDYHAYTKEIRALWGQSGRG